MKIKREKHSVSDDASPIAIIWRPLEYFSSTLDENEDDLDKYQYISYSIGNEHRFDLRRYRGDYQYNVSIYISLTIEISNNVNEIVDLISSTMAIPEYSIAWKLGIIFEYGRLMRSSHDRLREREARVIAMKIASLQQNKFAKTSLIKSETPKFTELTDYDLRQSPSRPNEKIWKQIIGNVVSHETPATSIFKNGWALKQGGGIQMTEKGIAYLNSLGFF